MSGILAIQQQLSVSLDDKHIIRVEIFLYPLDQLDTSLKMGYRVDFIYHEVLD